MSHRHISALFLLVIAPSFIAGCSSSTSTEGPPPSGVVRTDPQYLDPPLDEAFIRYLIDSSTSQPQSIAEKGHDRIQWIADTAVDMAKYAMSLVTEDSAKHIPYVWGGKQLAQPSEWASPPDTNKKGCTARIGLDCSGFVGLVLAHFGFRPDLPEVSVAGLLNSNAWAKIKNRGYQVLYFGSPKARDLLPGDILIFTDDVGNLVHTGIFYSQTAKFGTGTQPGFVNSTGHSSCWRNYAEEANNHLTGVVLSPFGPKTEARTFFAIRIVASEHVRFAFNGNEYINHTVTSVASVILDTANMQLNGFGYDDSNSTSKNAAVHFIAVGVNGKGTFEIPPGDRDSITYSEFYAIPTSQTFNGDSIDYYVTPPPKWWHGGTVPEPGGQLMVTSFAHDTTYGTIAGNFTMRGNAYWSRTEDSVYYVDSLQVKWPVTRYYFDSKEVKGSFEGILGLQ
jgi:hypothetical protein